MFARVCVCVCMYILEERSMTRWKKFSCDTFGRQTKFMFMQLTTHSHKRKRDAENFKFKYKFPTLFLKYVSSIKANPIHSASLYVTGMPIYCE